MGSTYLPEDTVAALEQCFAQLAGDFNQDGSALVRVNQFITADPDGSCPDETDYSAEGKTVLWSDCFALSEMDPGSYTAVITGNEVTGDSQELLSGLHLGRRCFYTDKAVDYYSQCNELWNTILGTKDI